MSDVSQKFSETLFFYNHMKVAHAEENIENFAYFFSAFLSASRTVTEFTEKKAKKLRKIAEYNQLTNESQYVNKFRRLRNANIHSKPIKTTQMIETQAKVKIGIGTVYGVQITKYDRNGELIQEDVLPKVSEQPVPSEVDIYPTKRIFTIQFQDNEQSVLELCRAYIGELRLFVALVEGSKSGS